MIRSPSWLATRESRFPNALTLSVEPQPASVTVATSTRQRVDVATGIVRWVRGEEYGVETLEMDEESQADLDEYLRQRESESDENSE